MEISGNVISILPEVTGQGKNGTWRKQEFILETDGQYPKKVCIAMWGDKIDQFGSGRWRRRDRLGGRRKPRVQPALVHRSENLESGESR